MKVKFGDQEFLIEFAYHTFQDNDGCGHVAEVTACAILDGSAHRAPKTPAPQLASGKATRYFRDKPNREVGRRAAFESALRCLDLSYATLLSPTEAKARRRAFWEVFLNRKKACAQSSRELIARLAIQEMDSCRG